MKQLSQEHTIFKGVNTGFRVELERINKDRNALRALTVKGFDKTLEEMNERLEYIQKNLNDFLKMKRKRFPRFFFLSNEDLLEIMGQSKDLTPMNKHVKKRFEGIAHLQISKQSNKAKSQQIIGFSAPDSEETSLTTPISGNDKVEDWFIDLLRGMKSEVKALFKDPSNPLKEATKSKTGNEKLASCIRERKGQYLITISQIGWTKEVNNTFLELEVENTTHGYKKIKGLFKNRVDKYTNYVQKLADEPRMRSKLVSLITIEQHHKDIIDSLHKK